MILPLKYRILKIAQWYIKDKFSIIHIDNLIWSIALYRCIVIYIASLVTKFHFGAILSRLEMEKVVCTLHHDDVDIKYNRETWILHNKCIWKLKVQSYDDDDVWRSRLNVHASNHLSCVGQHQIQHMPFPFCTQKLSETLSKCESR